MIDLNLENYRRNAELLLQGIWYSNLPDMLDMDELIGSVDRIFDEINNQNAVAYKQESDEFISDWKNVVSPPYIRSPGAEAITFFDFKKNHSLREMQVPNLVFYISFVYNTLLEFEPLFSELYINHDNSRFVENSNSYLVFEDAFLLDSYEGDEDWVFAGTFSTKNNKINTSTALAENKKRLLRTEADYLYSLKMDIESFFPNLYTHNFEKMAKKLPYSGMSVDFRYFEFLDKFHQRINNNQTKGIPAGVFSSHVAAELCMLCVDEEIRNYIETKNYRISYVRYVDDLTFFSDSEIELATLYPAVQSILNHYRLRINGNKTETLHAAFINQPAYIDELEKEFPILQVAEESKSLHTLELFSLKKYITDCFSSDRASQVRALLSIIHRKILTGVLIVSDISYELFCYLLKLVFEDTTLVCHAYQLLDTLLLKADDTQAMLNALINKRNKIDEEYPDTLLQIWHYYVLFRHSDDAAKAQILNSIKAKKYNPLVITTMVLPGKNCNRELFVYIRDTYIEESQTEHWQQEIMYSKWWLPLFKIFRYDSHNYDHFMNSSNFPSILKVFSRHGETAT